MRSENHRNLGCKPVEIFRLEGSSGTFVLLILIKLVVSDIMAFVRTSRVISKTETRTSNFKSENKYRHRKEVGDEEKRPDETGCIGSHTQTCSIAGPGSCLGQDLIASVLHANVLRCGAAWKTYSTLYVPTLRRV
jgi:hypothetical protein